MRRVKKLIVPHLLIFVGVIAAAIPTYSWFINNFTVANESITGGSIFNYYARGSGTQTDPYVLTKPKHVYNFAWLQNRGTYQDQVTYFELGADIDMAGYLNGWTEETGAIPPIGTTSEPFLGEFDGQGHVISNLWVSSDPNDWQEKPENSNIDVGTDIGFFGCISSVGSGSTGRIGHATNFYLENIEITCNVDNANVGVACGYLNGSLKNVGVKNSKVSLENCSNTYSRFSFVGKTSNDVDISEVATDKSGGDLVINPTVSNPGNINSGSIMQVPNSAAGRAFYVGKLSSSSPKPSSADTAVLINGKIDYTTSLSEYRASTSNMRQITNGSEVSDPDCYDAIASGDYKKMIKFDSAPNFSVTGANDYPKNCVWFKPLQGGTVAIAFCRQNNKGDESMSLYRFSRLSDGKIDTSTIKETKFTFVKGAVVGNGGNMYFEIELDKSEARGYEFAIGNSTINSGGSAGFVYMKLAGANIDGGGEESETGMALNKVDFVESTSVDLMTFTVHNSNLVFEIASSSSSFLYFNALESDHKTHYCSDPSNLISEKIANSESQLEGVYSSATFPDRNKTRPSS